jgi:uncharacterized membrane protein
MKPWLFYGILASLAFGISAIPLKYASNQKYLAGPLGVIIIGSGLGALLVLLPYLLYKGQLNIAEFSANCPALFWSILSGAIGAVGTVSIIVGLNNPSTDVSRLMAIVSTSVLVTAVLGIIFLKEIPSGLDRLKLLAGIILIIFGIRLVI